MENTIGNTIGNEKFWSSPPHAKIKKKIGAPFIRTDTH
jgi:hypothetical protein